MISFFGKKVGVDINNKSYFSQIKFNNNKVKEIKVNGTTVAFGGYIPPLIYELEAQGCAYILSAFDNYPVLYQCIIGEKGMIFDGASYFATDVIPSYTDVVDADITLIEQTSPAKTVWCTRQSGTASLTTFIINSLVRFDTSSSMGATSWFPALNIGQKYRLKQSPSENIVAIDDNERTISVSAYTMSNPISIGASYESYKTPLAGANYLNKTSYHQFRVMGNDGMYKSYIVPIETNKMMDLVTGTIFENLGSGEAIIS